MQHYVNAYVGAAIVFLGLDVLWLSVIGKSYYFSRISHLMLDRPNLAAAAVFYLVYLIGVIIFAVAPAIREGSFLTAASYGALFGFFAYATYDVTNFATLKSWPIELVIVDVAWGTFLTMAAAVSGYGMHRLFSDG